MNGKKRMNLSIVKELHQKWHIDGNFTLKIARFLNGEILILFYKKILRIVNTRKSTGLRFVLVCDKTFFLRSAELIFH